MTVKKIAIFASGSGTNAQKIMEYFAEKQEVVVDSLWSNNPQSFALKRAENFGVETFVFTRDELRDNNKLIQQLHERKIDLIVLAGFLWLIPPELIRNFRIVNIHPALLPKYGGKGMYGMKVHEAVVKNHEPESGITIHFVDEIYDNGKIIFQAKCKVESDDTPEKVAEKVHQLEYRYFPEVIEKVLSEN